MARNNLLLLFMLFAVVQAGLIDFAWPVPWRVTNASTPTHLIASTAYVPPTATKAPIVTSKPAASATVTSSKPSGSVPTTFVVSSTSAKAASTGPKVSFKSVSIAPSKTSSASTARSSAPRSTK